MKNRRIVPCLLKTVEKLFENIGDIENIHLRDIPVETPIEHNESRFQTGWGEQSGTQNG